ncbi:MAG: hypothetical protein FJ379_15655, partial [Verrucomicrobia bacterium]|nr:hypothetical protein [Verrucomicrobiota bacterium]
MTPKLVLILLLVGSAVSGWTQTPKPIRLRTETLLPPTRGGVARAAMPVDPDPASSGLFLVQFRSTPNPETRDRLLRLGVSLLQYVPEDAFLARLISVPLATLRRDP